MTLQRRTLLAGGAAALWGCGEAPVNPASALVPLTAFPRPLDPGCGNGRARLYDECGSQLGIYEAALQAARAAQKTLIVNYGAEWCIWCHVFDAYLGGQAGRFRYPVEGQQVTLVEHGGSSVISDALNDFAARTFVLAHIEGDNAPDGWSVLEASGAASQFNGEYPFVFSVTPAGQMAAVFEHEAVEVRRDNGADWYRGYNRTALLAELRRMRDAAVASR